MDKRSQYAEANILARFRLGNTRQHNSTIERFVKVYKVIFGFRAPSMGFFQMENFCIKSTKINWHLKLFYQNNFQNIVNSRIAAHKMLALQTAKFHRIPQLWVHLWT